MIYPKLTHIDHDTTSEGVHSGAVWVFGTCGGSFSSHPRFLYDTVRGCTSQPSKGCKECVIGGSVTMMRELHLGGDGVVAALMRCPIVLGRVAARSRCFLDFSYDTVRGCTSQLSRGCKCVGQLVLM